MPNAEVFRLSNGLRVLYTHHPGTPVTHCGLMIKAGTRDEEKGQEGLAHFIEHGLFKGTKNRKSFHILNRLEVVGGELNAYTTKEETCVHASVMNSHAERAIDLIADIVFNSIFPEKEIEKEKDVIVDEIRSYQDTPYEQIFDDFEGLLFKGHSLGHPILGTEKALRSFKRKDLLEYIRRCYHPSRMVFAVSGSMGIDEVIRLGEKYFTAKFPAKKAPVRSSYKKYKPALTLQPKPISQVHHITGVPAYAMSDKKRFVLVLLNNLLGGPGMNSRLNLNIREKYGFTYTIESGYHSYSDTGIFHVYFATDQKNYEKTKKLVELEFDRLKDKPLSKTAFRQYKEQLLGQITMAQENRLSVLLSITKGLLNFDRVVRLEEVFDRINMVTETQVQEAAVELFDMKSRSTLVYEPKLTE